MSKMIINQATLFVSKFRFLYALRGKTTWYNFVRSLISFTCPRNVARFQLCTSTSFGKNYLLPLKSHFQDKN